MLDSDSIIQTYDGINNSKIMQSSMSNSDKLITVEKKLIDTDNQLDFFDDSNSIQWDKIGCNY